MTPYNTETAIREVARVAGTLEQVQAPRVTRDGDQYSFPVPGSYGERQLAAVHVTCAGCGTPMYATAAKAGEAYRCFTCRVEQAKP